MTRNQKSDTPRNGFARSLDLFGVEQAASERERVLTFVEFLREDNSSWDEAGVTEKEAVSDRWLPLAGMDQNQLPARIVVAPSSPELLRRSAKKLAARLGHAELRELPGDRPAHLADPQGLATLILELLRS